MRATVRMAALAFVALGAGACLGTLGDHQGDPDEPGSPADPSGPETPAPPAPTDNVIDVAIWPRLWLADATDPAPASTAELCRLVKTSIPGQPVVLFSALPEDHLENLAKTCGADAHVAKTEGLAGLVATVSELCERIIW